MADVASKQQTTALFLFTTVTCTRHTELTIVDTEVRSLPKFTWLIDIAVNRWDTLSDRSKCRSLFHIPPHPPPLLTQDTAK
jgi:hypothetical protein